MPKVINPLEHLRALVDKRGSQKAVASELGVSQAFVSDLLQGHRQFSGKILRKMGLRNIVVVATEQEHERAS